MSNNKHCFTENWYLSSLLNHHINGMVERYSCLLALRMDLFYQKNTDSFTSLNHSKLECDIRSLMLEIERDKKMVGYFWVIEWTERHGYHAHVVFWLDRQKTQTCSGQQKLATALEFFQNNRSDSFGVRPPLY